MDYFHLSVGQDLTDTMSSLALAHLGDGVYELMVRTWLCLKGKATNKGLHRAAVTYVSAPAQAKRVKKILPILTDEEQDVYRRARNSHTAAIPKGASVGEYHAATGLEALFGWLYLRGQLDRLNELFEQMMTEE
ncbi:MAG TPA: ribonuclease III [Candidatus Enterenecus avicola]|nr:ribonuclease III [Candidatus Enterenecus avicola]